MCLYLFGDVSLSDQQQVLQVRVEQRTVDHRDPQSLLHNEPHGAVVREPDYRRRLLEPGAPGNEMNQIELKSQKQKQWRQESLIKL